MATAQYDTHTRTVEETVVVLTLTEDEADALKEELILISGSAVVRQVLNVLRRPTTEQPAPSADTFEYDGVTYELGATYTDTDGDPWYFARFDGEVLGNNYRAPEDRSDGSSLRFVMRYRPLTKVTP